MLYGEEDEAEGEKRPCNINVAKRMGGEGKGGGEKGQTCKARGKRAKYLFVHKVSLHSNEVLHNVFSKQIQPSSTQAELPEGDMIPTRALSAQRWPVSREGLPVSRRATGRGQGKDAPWGHQAAPTLILEGSWVGISVPGGGGRSKCTFTAVSSLGTSRCQTTARYRSLPRVRQARKKGLVPQNAEERKGLGVG